MVLSEINKLVISLPDRHDRRKECRKELEGFGTYQFVNGVFDVVPRKGIAQAHKNCIQIAIQNEWDNVLIMEDDVCFQGKEKTIPYLHECLRNLPSNWDMLLGGVYDSNCILPYNNYWDRTETFCGLHFYIANRSIYDRILACDGSIHIDRWINLNNNRDCFVTKKFVATQRAGKSDNTGQVQNYEAKLKHFRLL